MKKIKSLFVRRFDNGHIVEITREITPGCEWVMSGQLPRPIKGRGLLKASLPLMLMGFATRSFGPNVTPHEVLPNCTFACIPGYTGLRSHRRVIDNTRFP